MGPGRLRQLSWISTPVWVQEGCDNCLGSAPPVWVQEGCDNCLGSAPLALCGSRKAATIGHDSFHDQLSMTSTPLWVQGGCNSCLGPVFCSTAVCFVLSGKVLLFFTIGEFFFTPRLGSTTWRPMASLRATPLEPVACSVSSALWSAPSSGFQWLH